MKYKKEDINICIYIWNEIEIFMQTKVETREYVNSIGKL